MKAQVKGALITTAVVLGVIWAIRRTEPGKKLVNTVFTG